MLTPTEGKIIENKFIDAGYTPALLSCSLALITMRSRKILIKIMKKGRPYLVLLEELHKKAIEKGYVK